MRPPLLSVCLCMLVTCSARPNWHKGVVVGKDLPAHPGYNEAQIAAAQAIREAGEDAQLHLAMLKKKYMDIVRQNFYNAFAPIPFVKERLDNFEQNPHSEDVQPVRIIPPQPIYIHHAAGNPCSGNILNCLHSNSPSRLGKIVPPPSAGLQPCFGPNCNHVFFNPQFKPVVIPKPSHSSHSKHQNPSKRPHKHHRICDRKRPDQNCNHRSTFWPTYATVKLNTKPYPPTSTYSPKEINRQSSLPPLPTPSESHGTKELQQHLILHNNESQQNPISVHSNNDTRFDIETLRSNSSKLENEILGIPEDVTSNSGTQSIVSSTAIIQSPPKAKNEFHAESVSSPLSVNPNSSTLETTTQLNPEFKEDVENILPLKTQINFTHTTPELSFHTNDVIETTTRETIKLTQTSDKSFEEEKKITTSSIFSQTTTESNHFKLEDDTDPSIQVEISTESMSLSKNNAMFDQITSNNLKQLKDLVADTTLVKEEDYTGTTMINIFNRFGEEKSEDSTSFPGELKLESNPTTIDQNPELKSVIELITIAEPLPGDSSSSTHYDQNVLVTNVNDNQQTTVATDYFSEDGTLRMSSLRTNWEENEQSLHTTMKIDNEYITQIIDNDLVETASRETLFQPSSESIFENTHEHKEFTVQTTFRTVEDLTQNNLGYSIDLGREDTAVTDGSATTGNSDIGSQNIIAEENTLPVTFFSNSDSYKVFEETTLEPVSDFSVGLRDSFVPTTESSINFNLNKCIDTEDNQKAREETFTDSYLTDSHSSTQLDDFQKTQSGLEDFKGLSTQFPDFKKSGNDLITTEDPLEPVTDLSFGLRDNLFSTTETIDLNLNQNIGTENKPETREDIFTGSYLTDPDSSAKFDDFQSTPKGLEDFNDLSTQLPNTEKSGLILITTEYSTDSMEPNSATDLINFDVSAQNNDFSGPTFLARENVQEPVTDQESSSDLQVEKKDSITSVEVPLPNNVSTRAQTESSYFQETTEVKESKINWEEENNLFQPTMKPMEEWTREKAETTEYFPSAREEPSEDNDQYLSNVEDTTLDQTPAVDEVSYTKTDYGIVQGETTTSVAKSIEVTTDTTTLLNSITDNVNHLASVIEIKERFTTLNSENDIFRLTEENENPSTSTSQTSTDDKEDNVPENSLNGLPQSREDGEGDPQETHVLIEVTSETSTIKETTENQEEHTTSLTITENIHDKGAQDINVTEDTEVPELRENIHESSPVSTTNMIDYTETVHTESELNKESMKSTTDETEEKSFESNLIIPQDLFGKTDTPGLIISEDWTEEQTEDTSLNILTEFTAAVKSAYTEYPQSKADEEEYISEVVPHFSATEITDVDVTEGTESTNLKLDQSTETVEAATISPSFAPEIYGKTAAENMEGTRSVNPFDENPSFPSYQSGVLKFTTEIETTEHSLSTEVTEGSTNPGLAMESNDSLKRKARSVQHIKDEVISYPTTECILCLLGLPHGHRMKRSPENTSHTTVAANTKTNVESKVMQSENPNSSSSTNLNLEDPENSRFYASTILELLPVIREGYRNNAFSEEDKKVIRSLFGDMKGLVDEDTFERITESTGDLLMGDGASRIDEIIDEIDYDSSEDEMSEVEIRLKRSKKNVQIVNDLLKKIPNNLKSHLNVPSQMKNSRVVRSTHVSPAEASAILALLTEKGEAVQLDIPDDEDDDEYEYYEDEGDEYGDEDSYADAYEDDYDKPSFGELIKLARKHKDRKARAEQS